MKPVAPMVLSPRAAMMSKSPGCNLLTLKYFPYHTLKYFCRKNEHTCWEEDRISDGRNRETPADSIDTVFFGHYLPIFYNLSNRMLRNFPSLVETQGVVL